MELIRLSITSIFKKGNNFCFFSVILSNQFKSAEICDKSLLISGSTDRRGRQLTIRFLRFQIKMKIKTLSLFSAQMREHLVQKPQKHFLFSYEIY